MSSLRGWWIGAALLAPFGFAACTQDFEKFDGEGSALVDASSDAPSTPRVDASVPPVSDGGVDAADAADASPCALATSCVSTQTACTTTCSQTKDTCMSKCGSNGPCKKNCSDAESSCTSKCRATCRSCAPACTQACN